MRTVRVMTTVVVLGLAGRQAAAQAVLPVAIEARGGVAFPTGEWNDEDALDTGFGFGANLQLQVAPLLGVYGGWERYSFGFSDEIDLEGADVKAVDSGARVGLQLNIPTGPVSAVKPFVSAGLIYQKTSVKADGNGGSLEFSSDNALGVEAGAGVAVPLTPQLSLTPAIRFQTHQAEFDAFQEFGDNKTRASHVTLDIGLRFGM